MAMFDGRRVDDRTARMLTEAQTLFGRPIRLTQGSYSTGVGASAGTHAGGGSFDVDLSGYSTALENKLVVILRTVGFAFYVRPAIPGKWNRHGHGIALGCIDLSPAAQRQAAEYLAGGDGLVGGNPDPHRALNAPKQTWEQYLRTKDDEMLSDQDVERIAAATAKAVWNLEAKEYVDENGNGQRDSRRVMDILFAAHGMLVQLKRR